MYDTLRMIPFTLTPDQVAAMTAAAPFNIWTGESSSSLIRVPMLLVLSKPAGDAYTVAAGGRIQVADEDGNILWSVNCLGFMDQATAQSRVLRPTIAGGGIGSLPNYKFDLSCSAGLTKGTASPNLNGRLFYDQVQVGF